MRCSKTGCLSCERWLRNVNDLVLMFFRFTRSPVERQPLSGFADGELSANDENAGRVLLLDEFDKVIGHGVTVVRDQNAIFFGAEPQHFGIGNAGVQVEFRRALKIHAGLHTFCGAPQCLRPDRCRLEI